MSGRPKVLVSPLLAVSTLNQANLIKKLIVSSGYDCEFKKTITYNDVLSPEVHSVLWFQLATVEFLNEAVFPFLQCRKPKAIYVTIEGVPRKSSVLCSNLPRLEYIANSRFTKKCLEYVGFRIKDVVHHGVDTDLAKKAFQTASLTRARILKNYKDKCVFLFVGRNDPRKGLPALSEAVQILLDKGRRDFVLLLVTEESAKPMFAKPNCVFYAKFGSMEYFKILQLMSAVDYVVFPSYCEGFGLPLLEANSVGTPVIHAWAPPFDEFSSKDFNFVFDYTEEKMVPCGNSQWWLFHTYPPEFLAEMMDYAIDVWKNHKDELGQYCVKAMEHAENWDYRRVYRKLLKYIGVEVKEDVAVS
ncbi:MAG: glycosyltransferase [Candidatus Baldrarchaeia archaeon]